MELSDNDFDLFGLPLRFALSTESLHQQWTALQRQTHPDKFVTHGASAQRLAMQWSVRVNEAYQRLKSPLLRAQVLCELAGYKISAETNTSMSAAFLMQQMQWREALEEAKSPHDLDVLHDEVMTAQAAILEQLGQALDVQSDFPAAVQRVRELMFIEKMRKEVEHALDQS